ncbi:hypothetical protein [Aquimarina pacifica]|uniref:hypothetical protein n=1 Tax=Aquimarina pacifica TaxID=1296415 RepID=UPI00046EFD53|nr:hypothetical protein [Aquimarina pacifica]
MDILEAIEAISDSIFEGVDNLVDILIPYCSILASIFMVVLVGVRVIKYFINPSENMDPLILVKPILILAAIVLYQHLIDFLLIKPVDLVTSLTNNAVMTTLNISNLDNFLDIANAQLTTIKNESTNDNGQFSIYEVLQLSTFLEIFHLFIQIIALVITGYILMRQVLLKAIYFVIGILVLPFSLIPGNFEILKRWFFGFLAVLLWIPILRIFQAILVLINQAELPHFSQPLFSVVLQIVMILFIIQVPKYANFLVSGSGDSDGNGYFHFAGRELYYNKISPKIWGGKKGGTSKDNTERQGK